VAATILVDGFVQGAWKVEKTKTTAAVVIEPFNALASTRRAALEEEGLALLQFIEPQAKSLAVQWKE